MEIPPPPGNADVPVGSVGKENADEDVGAPRESIAPRGWYSRGYLPHRDERQLIQSVTFRLADSLPRAKLEALEAELSSLPPEHVDTARRQRIETWLDAGWGCCALRHPEVAQHVEAVLLHFHDQRYHLHAWCIMPNHVHLLVEPFGNLADMVQGWKSVTARWALKQNQRLNLRIPDAHHLWMREYWDRYIRDQRHYANTLDYIHHNPVKAGLCQRREDWQWSSAWERRRPRRPHPA